jgi:hypothetical protein
LQLLLALAAQSFSGSSPVGLMITFHCLKFEIFPTWRTRPRISTSQELAGYCGGIRPRLQTGN